MHVLAAATDLAIGPDSVGYAVATEALCVGGDTLTLSDVSLASGRLDGFGDPSLVDHLDASLLRECLAWVDDQVSIMSDRMKSSRDEITLLAVGGGAHLIAERVPGTSQVLRPQHYSVANAYGAGIAEASGTVDRVYSYDRGAARSVLTMRRSWQRTQRFAQALIPTTSGSPRSPRYR